MILKAKPYIICEGYPEFSETKVTDGTINGKVIAEVILQTANERNRNGRFYSSDELFPQLKAPRTLELLESGKDINKIFIAKGEKQGSIHKIIGRAKGKGIRKSDVSTKYHLLTQ